MSNLEFNFQAFLPRQKVFIDSSFKKNQQKLKILPCMENTKFNILLKVQVLTGNILVFELAQINKI